MATKIVTLPNDGTRIPKTVLVSTRPWWLFWLLPGYTITLYPSIYTSKKYFSVHNHNLLRSICVHEAVHLRQQEPSKFNFYVNYIFSRQFRYKAEFEAYLEEFKFQMSEKNTPSIEAIADNLASIGYFWCVNKDKAIRDFRTALSL